MIPLFDTLPHRRTPWLTLLIIAVNVVAMIWLSQVPGLHRFQVVAQYGFIPQRIRQLRDPKLVVQVQVHLPQGAVLARPAGRAQRVLRIPSKPWQIYASLVTMMFLHGSWLHLIGNMWFLWIFGNNIEDRLGHLIFVVFYFLGGLLATFCHWLSEPASSVPVIGASGAVAAVLGAYAITYPNAKVRTLFFIFIITVIDVPALVYLGLWFLMQLSEALGFFAIGPGGGVAWWAHVGGFLAGMLLMPLLALGAPPPGEDWKAETDELFRF